jgi:putative drug exporter of the RND superfamily
MRRLAEMCFRRRGRVLIAWVLGIMVLGGVSGAIGTGYRSDFTLPDVESKHGIDILKEHFGGQGAGIAGNIVFQADQGVNDPQVRQTLEQFLGQVAAIPGLQKVTSPYSPDARGQISENGKIAYAGIEAPSSADFKETAKIGTQIKDLMPKQPGLRVELGGSAFASFEVPSSEALGLGFAVIILILAFGSVLAMGLPIGVALAGIASGTVVGGLLSNAISMPDFASTIGIMIGLGVGIDYALFIVTRFRENLHKGYSIEASTLVAMETAGRAVLFAGTTVVISLMGMLIMQLGFISGLAIGAAVVVAMTMLASLTLLPALLGFAARRVEVTRRRGLVGAGLIAVALISTGLGATAVALPAAILAALVILVSFAFAPLRKQVLDRPPKPVRETLAYRWSRVIQHHPWAALLVGLAVVIVLALPVFGLRLGFSDEGNFPKDTTTKQAYDLLAEGFGAGFNGPLVLAANLPAGVPRARLDAISDAIGKDADVAFASPAVVDNDASPTAVLWRVVPKTAPQDAATTALVNRLRNDVLPQATAGSGVKVSVAGSVAVGVDFTEYLSARLPWFFGAVLTLSFLLLMVVFRSVLVPLKAVVMNLLSLGAAYGIVVAVFQEGHFGSLLNIAGAPIEPFVPMMLFAIVFGLSMDYEVFLLSRVREEWERTGDSRTSVADGLAVTARVITAAAAIMVLVFGSFMGEADRVVKLFGLGLSMAVLIDASVVRMLLVPATMELLGDRNWWMPPWLGRMLPRVHIEAPADLEAELARLTEGERSETLG